MGDNSLYIERKSRKGRGSAGRKKEKAEKELTCMYAYNDGGNDIKRVCRSCGVLGYRMPVTWSWTRDRNNLSITSP